MSDGQTKTDGANCTGKHGASEALLAWIKSVMTNQMGRPISIGRDTTADIVRKINANDRLHGRGRSDRDRQTEQLKAELKRVAIEAAEAAICRRLDSLVLPHADTDLTDDQKRLGTTHRVRRLPHVPNAIKGRPFTLKPVRQNAEGQHHE